MNRSDTPLRGTGILTRAPGGYEGTVLYCGIAHRCFVARQSALDGVDRISVEIRDAAHDELPPEALRPAFEDVPVPEASGVALSPRRRLPKKLVNDEYPF